MPTNKQYEERIVEQLKSGIVPKGRKVAIAVETKAKGEDIIERVNKLLPNASEDWDFNIAVLPFKQPLKTH